MADPLFLSVAILSIISSATNFAAATSALTKNARNSADAFQSQSYEIDVMCEVLNECRGIIETSRNTTIPVSVERTLDICQTRFLHLMSIMEQSRKCLSQSNGTLKKLVERVRLLALEDARNAAFSGFRSTTLLLRDLCTEYVSRFPCSGGVSCGV